MFISTKQFAQNNLTLVSKKNLDRQKKINLDEKVEIKTNNNYYHSNIVSFNQTEIKIIETNLKRNGTNNNPYNWVNDTLKISFQEIEYLKTYRYGNRGWVIPFATVSVLTIGSVFFTPLVLATKGRAAANKLTVIQLSIIVITLPPILIGISKKKYDLKNKWKIKALE